MLSEKPSPQSTRKDSRKIQQQPNYLPPPYSSHSRNLNLCVRSAGRPMFISTETGTRCYSTCLYPLDSSPHRLRTGNFACSVAHNCIILAVLIPDQPQRLKLSLALNLKHWLKGCEFQYFILVSTSELSEHTLVLNSHHSPASETDFIQLKLKILIYSSIKHKANKRNLSITKVILYEPLKC